MKNVRLSVAGCLIVGTLALFATGCATNRGILDIRIEPGINPEDGPPVMITRVVDSRVFELKPSEPNVPSLRGGEIDDPAITSRAIARKRNSFGKAMGDVLLPEGRTVQDVVREAVEKALQEKGYRVIDSAASTSVAASPLEVEVAQFWAWFRPGFWSIALDFRATITLKGPVTLSGTEETVEGSVTRHGQAATGGAWTKTIMQGLDDLIANTKEKLKDPRTP